MIDPRFDKAIVCLIAGFAGLLVGVVIIFLGLALAEMRHWRRKL